MRKKYVAPKVTMVGVQPEYLIAGSTDELVLTRGYDVEGEEIVEFE